MKHVHIRKRRARVLHGETSKEEGPRVHYVHQERVSYKASVRS